MSPDHVHVGDPKNRVRHYGVNAGVFRTVLYQAGKRLGVDAANLLEQIPDDDLRLFASIEFAAALGGVPGPRIIQMKQPNPPQSGSFGSGRMISPAARGREAADAPGIRSPDGRLIRCYDIPSQVVV